MKFITKIQKIPEGTPFESAVAMVNEGSKHMGVALSANFNGGVLFSRPDFSECTVIAGYNFTLRQARAEAFRKAEAEKAFGAALAAPADDTQMADEYDYFIKQMMMDDARQRTV